MISIWTLVDLALFGMAAPAAHHHPPAPAEPPAPIVCHEDQECWEARTMGDRCWGVDTYDEETNIITTVVICADVEAVQAFGNAGNLWITTRPGE